MMFYNARVRLSGELLHEVNKEGLSPAEIIVLQSMHGDDGVVNLEEAGEQKTESHAEYDRLCEVYTDKRVGKIFGPKFSANLPKTVVGMEARPKPESEAPRDRKITLKRGAQNGQG